ncbi:hypothetical protein PVAND_017499 [Polypedilum vanderplanki]
MASEIIDIKDENDFKSRVLNSNKPVLIGVYTPWCESCRITMPRIEKVADEFKDKISLAKVNADELPDLAIKHDINRVPSLVVAFNGKIISQLQGMQEVDEIRKFVKGNPISKQQRKRYIDEKKFQHTLMFMLQEAST